MSEINYDLGFLGWKQTKVGRISSTEKKNKSSNVKRQDFWCSIASKKTLQIMIVIFTCLNTLMEPFESV